MIRYRYFGRDLLKSLPNPVHASKPSPIGVPVIEVGTAASTPSSRAKAKARTLESFFKIFCKKNTGTKTVRKLSGIVMIQSTTAHSARFHKLSTATRTRADKA